jgi:hypothetical protein
MKETDSMIIRYRHGDGKQGQSIGETNSRVTERRTAERFQSDHNLSKSK